EAVSAWIARLESAARARAERSEDLLAAVYAAPGDDAPRLVYADWLSERSDPRGEFLSLQIARATSGARTTARERALLVAHQDEWLGPLRPILLTTGLRLERGFLATFPVQCRSAGAADAVRGQPAWATVHSIALHGDAHAIVHPVMRSLQRLGGAYRSASILFSQPDAWPLLERAGVWLAAETQQAIRAGG